MPNKEDLLTITDNYQVITITGNFYLYLNANFAAYLYNRTLKPQAVSKQCLQA